VVPLVPVVFTVSQVRCVTASTVRVRPANASISGMNGSPSTLARPSRVVRISSGGLIRTRSPTRSWSARTGSMRAADVSMVI
jgi:hypothetical protein